MKKTLAALIIGAFAASAANAVTIYNNEGTKVDLDGSLRVVLEKSNKGGEGEKRTHSGLKNSGSRVSINVKHSLDDGYYALGRVEVRFDGKQGGTVREDGFGNLNTKRAYVGLGHKEFGELTFGRQVTIADDLSTSNDYAYGIVEKGDYIPTDGNSVIRYDYKGIENLQLGASYQFADNRDGDNEVVNDSIQHNYQVGAVYNGKWDDKQGIIAKFGYGRTNYKVENKSNKHHQDGFLASLGYQYNDFVLYVDGGYAKEKNGSLTLPAGTVTTDVKKFFVAPGFIAPLSKESSIYGNYKYEHTKYENADAKKKLHGFLLGVDYKLHKQVIVFLEGKYQETKEYLNGNYVDDSKVKDKAIGVGMRVYF
ncbi:porin [Rodentibacter pneumotropicus]|uniref:Porin n=1 Tax=Rodentibacter pneumotropicus TaxID=758 RepID=A0A4S2QKT3_9PAST|nr:porin [Rodentibacter pneumotropicus]THA00292.1 porin [Rodentibacter pneumotropicus]THA02608.1 porin [Rodentibacter pneumotropicus]THA08281.1 porin [Rodentibacter pneumotropicus]THA17923.1 porin [Rodentibacter pneumotropicus]